MTIQEFAGQVIETLQAKFPEYFRDAEFQVQQVAKPGNLILTGIGIRMKNTPISPLYYIDSALQNGQSAEETAKEIASQIAKQSSLPDSIDVNFVSDFESAKQFIVPRLIDIRPGKNDAYIKNRVMTQFPFVSIGIIYDIALPNNKTSSMSIPVTKDLQLTWNASTKAIHDAAIQNGPRIRPLKIASLAEMLGLPFELDDMAPMTVLTNSVGVHGASSILYPATKELLEERFPNGFICIPSSVHEWIIISKDLSTDTMGLLDMVKTINANEVLPEDQLADDVFTLDDEGHLVSIA